MPADWAGACVRSPTQIRDEVTYWNNRDKASKIETLYRISFNITICIPSPIQPNRITGDVPPQRRVVVPEVIVVQPGLGVEVLARKSEVEGEGNAVSIRVFVRGALAEGGGHSAPDEPAVAIAHRPRRAQVVGVDVIHPGRLDDRERHPLQPHIFPPGVTR